MSGYDDVRGLLRHADVVPVGTTRATELVHREVHRDVHRNVHRTAGGAQSAAHRAQLLPALRERWRNRVQELEGRTEADLLRDLAVPWSLDVTALVTGVPREELMVLLPLARMVFRAAAESTTGHIPAIAEQAAATLAVRLGAIGASVASGASGEGGASGEIAATVTPDVQGVVALTHTLPCLLANVWRLLWQHPAAARALRDGAVPLPSALDELVRLAGPARAVFRETLAPVAVRDVLIPGGARVVLRLDEANHDAAVFPEPDRLDLTRPAAAQLAFGDGAHRCPGRHVVRGVLLAGVEGVLPLLPQWALAGENDQSGENNLAGDDDPSGDTPWEGGFAIHAPASLRVRRIVPVPAH